jgi:hypothetical protein
MEFGDERIGSQNVMIQHNLTRETATVRVILGSTSVNYRSKQVSVLPVWRIR